MAKKMKMTIINCFLSFLILIALVSYASLIIFEYDILLAAVFGSVVTHQILVVLVGVVGILGVIALLFQVMKRK